MRTNWMMALLACVLLAAPTRAEDAFPPALKDASVLVDVGDGFGSGVLFKNSDVTFVWTDAHVVSDLQEVKTVVDPRSGQPRVVVTYKDAYVVQEKVEGGRKVEERRALARIIRYSQDEDIAVLMVYKKDFGSASASFARGTPKVGEAVWHVGSFRGPRGSSSVADGVVASVGRLRRNFESDETNAPYPYDQISGTVQKGSSGGGVFLKSNNECVGLVTEFLAGGPSGLSYGAYVVTPARRLREFAKKNKVEYALDAETKAPAIGDIPAEDVTVGTLSLPKDWPGLPKQPEGIKPPQSIPMPITIPLPPGYWVGR